MKPNQCIICGLTSEHHDPMYIHHVYFPYSLSITYLSKTQKKCECCDKCSKSKYALRGKIKDKFGGICGLPCECHSQCEDKECGREKGHTGFHFEKDELPSPTQPDWRYCSNCKMKFSTKNTSGTCPQCSGPDVPYTNQEITQGIDKEITANKPDTQSWEEEAREIVNKIWNSGKSLTHHQLDELIMPLLHQVEEKVALEAYGQGHKDGKYNGRHSAYREIRKAIEEVERDFIRPVEGKDHKEAVFSNILVLKILSQLKDKLQ